MTSSFAARASQLLCSSALGAILQLFFQYLFSATEKLVDLESTLRSLESTLESINHAFPDGFRHDALSRRQMIEEGRKLIDKGSRVKWNVFKMWYYSTKINKLQASLDRLILNDVVVLGFQKTERTFEVVINLEEKMYMMMIEMANDIATMTRCQMTSKQGHVGSSDTIVVGCECGAAKQLRDKSFSEIVESGSGLSGNKANTTAESLSR